MKISRYLALAALTLLTAAASAATVSLDNQISFASAITADTTQNAIFFGNGDNTYTIDLGPGTYSLNSVAFGSMAANPITSVVYNGGTIPSMFGGALFAYVNQNLDKFVLTSPFQMTFAVTDPNAYLGAISITDYFVAPSTGGGGGVTIPAVPEPASGALLLAGIGLMALISKRRSQAK